MDFCVEKGERVELSVFASHYLTIMIARSAKEQEDCEKQNALIQSKETFKCTVVDVEFFKI